MPDENFNERDIQHVQRKIRLLLLIYNAFVYHHESRLIMSVQRRLGLLTTANKLVGFFTSLTGPVKLQVYQTLVFLVVRMTVLALSLLLFRFF